MSNSIHVQTVCHSKIQSRQLSQKDTFLSHGWQYATNSTCQGKTPSILLTPVPENHCCTYINIYIYFILYWTVNWSFKSIYEMYKSEMYSKIHCWLWMFSEVCCLLIMIMEGYCLGYGASLCFDFYIKHFLMHIWNHPCLAYLSFLLTVWKSSQITPFLLLVPDCFC